MVVLDMEVLVSVVMVGLMAMVEVGVMVVGVEQSVVLVVKDLVGEVVLVVDMVTDTGMMVVRCQLMTTTVVVVEGIIPIGSEMTSNLDFTCFVFCYM